MFFSHDHSVYKCSLPANRDTRFVFAQQGDCIPLFTLRVKCGPCALKFSSSEEYLKHLRERWHDVRPLRFEFPAELMETISRRHGALTSITTRKELSRQLMLMFIMLRLTLTILIHPILMLRVASTLNSRPRKLETIRFH